MTCILIAIGLMVVFMTGVWCWYLFTNNPSVVDVAWPIGILCLGFFYLQGAQHTWGMLTLAGIFLLWGLRLAGFLYWTRIRAKLHDKRYTTLDHSWSPSSHLAIFINYQFQGLLISLIALPWFFIAQKNAVTGLDSVAAMVALGAIVAESRADYELLNFKRKYPGEVCNRGLWHYSRHPNYFFEWLTWCAFSLCALPLPYGWLGLMSPLTLYLIMTRLTGPLTEQGSIKARGERYLAYQAVTPFFFPRIWR